MAQSSWGERGCSWQEAEEPRRGSDSVERGSPPGPPPTCKAYLKASLLGRGLFSVNRACMRVRACVSVSVCAEEVLVVGGKRRKPSRQGTGRSGPPRMTERGASAPGEVEERVFGRGAPQTHCLWFPSHLRGVGRGGGSEIDQSYGRTLGCVRWPEVGKVI